MQNFVLMAVLSLGYGQKQIMFQEFTSQEKCTAAIAEVVKIGSDTVERVVCLPK